MRSPSTLVIGANLVKGHFSKWAKNLSMQTCSKSISNPPGNSPRNQVLTQFTGKMDEKQPQWVALVLNENCVVRVSPSRDWVFFLNLGLTRRRETSLGSLTAESYGQKSH